MKTISDSHDSPSHRPASFPASQGLRWVSPGSAARHLEAFTLTELLVVLAVMLVLTLVPARARPQGPAQRTLCIDNLRQLMQAAAMYALDNHDLLPFPNWGNSQPGWLYTPVGGSPPAAANDAAYQGGLLWSYVRRTNTFRCPLDTPADPYWAFRLNKLSTYVMNGAVCGYGRSVSAFGLNQYAADAFCLWEPDENLSGGSTYNDASSYPDRNEGVGRLHSVGVPVGTFRGTVEWITYASFVGEQLQSGGTRVWCSPDTSDGR